MNKTNRGLIEEDIFKCIIPLSPEAAVQVAGEVTPEVTPEVGRLLAVMNGEMTRGEIQERLELKDEKHFGENYQQVGVKLGLIEFTIPDKPRRYIGVFILDRRFEIKIAKIDKKLNFL